ncbi:rhomboid family intramembrane serine protease [Propionibacteriaceae bacterium Y2011]
MSVVTPELRRATLVRSLPPVVLVVLMWLSEIVDTVLGGALDQYGIQPRELDGLPGILAAPLLHAGFEHLVANTATFIVLGLLVAWLTRHFWVVTIGVAVLGGAAVWLVGAPNTVHVGASGLVYGYTAFLVVYGFVARRITAVVIAVVVFLVYGSIVWGVLPTQTDVSWEGHLFGAVAGVVLAVLLGRRDRRRPRTALDA